MARISLLLFPIDTVCLETKFLRKLVAVTDEVQSSIDRFVLRGSMNRSASFLERFKIGERNFWIALSAFIFLLFFVFTVVPWWRDEYFGAASNESAAVVSLHKVNALETSYSAAHLDKGFACEFQLLQAAERTSDPHQSTDALSGESSGYTFALIGCAPELNGIVTHYQVTAVPTKPGVSGVRVFCTDQTGQLFYDNDSSVLQCFAARQLVPEHENHK
jgi:hypothetical protein